jgi:hypothetical protein
VGAGALRRVGEDLLAARLRLAPGDRVRFSRLCARVRAWLEGARVRRRLASRAAAPLLSEIRDIRALLADLVVGDQVSDGQTNACGPTCTRGAVVPSLARPCLLACIAATHDSWCLWSVLGLKALGCAHAQ